MLSLVYKESVVWTGGYGLKNMSGESRPSFRNCPRGNGGGGGQIPMPYGLSFQGGGGKILLSGGKCPPPP